MGRQRINMRAPEQVKPKGLDPVVARILATLLGSTFIAMVGWSALTAYDPYAAERVKQDVVSLSFGKLNGRAPDPIAMPSASAMVNAVPMVRIPDVSTSAAAGVASARVARQDGEWETSRTNVRRNYTETLTWLGSVNWVSRVATVTRENPWVRSAN